MGLETGYITVRIIISYCYTRKHYHPPPLQTAHTHAHSHCTYSIKNIIIKLHEKEN